MTIIYLDAGHGGKDGGAAANGLKEKDIVLDICKRIETGLKNNFQDVTILQSRIKDVFIPLSERTREANNAHADVLVSVHVNAATKTTGHGFETYRFSQTSQRTISFQNTLHEEILKAMGSDISDRGKKTATFHMLKNSKMSAVLTENLFISNPDEAKLLASEDFRQKIAQGHVNGLGKFLDLKRIERPPQETEKLYKVQVGAFSEKKNAEDLAKDLERLGYRPYVKYE